MLKTLRLLMAVSAIISFSSALAAEKVKLMEVEKKDSSLKLKFNWKEKVAAAAFNRGDYLWLVFDKYVLAENHQLTLLNAEQIKNSSFTILRIPNKSYQGKPISLSKEGQNWVAMVGGEANTSLNPLKIKIEDGGEKPRVFIENNKTAEPLKINDPEIGDTFVVIPAYNSGSLINPAQKFSQFSIMDTAQGIVLANLSDDIEYKVMRDGVEITSKSKLNISSQQKKTEPVKQQMKTVLPYKKLENIEPSEFNEMRQKLFSDILNAEEAKDKIKPRLELVDFYFINGFHDAALGIINDIEKTSPEYASNIAIKMVKNVNLYNLRRYREALKNLTALYNNPEYVDYREEISLWAWQAAFKLEDKKKESFWQKQEEEKEAPEKKPEDENISKAGFDIGSLKKGFFKDYPQSLRNEISLMLAEEKLKKGDVRQAERIIDYAIEDGARDNFSNSIAFLLAQVAEKSNSSEEAKIIYEQLIENVDDRFNRSRALVALARLELREGKITGEEAVKKLESAFMIWRGDKIELELLATLANFYMQEKDYMKAFQTWRRLVTNFPNTEEAVNTAARMRENFVDLFDSGDAYNLPPVQALALYFEFRELTPIGKTGDQMIRQLADYFVKADLLESAAVLLTHQMRYRSSGEERIDLANKLANVHLLNKKPKLALEILEFTDQEKMTSLQQNLRKYLKAKTYFMLGEYEKTMKQLAMDEGDEASEIRSDLYWETKDWDRLIRTLDDRLELRKLNPEKLSARETENLTRLAVAYSMKNNYKRLSQLEIDFSGFIPGEEEKKKFLLITGIKGKVNHRNFADALKIDDIEKLLASYEKKPEVQGNEEEKKILEGAETAVQ